MTSTPRYLTLGVVGVLALGGGTAAIASAASDAPTATKGPSSEKRAAAKAERDQELAAALGVSVDRLHEARDTVRTASRARRAEHERTVAEQQGVSVQELRDRRADRLRKRLAKPVERQRLTKEQADQLVAAVRDGEPLAAQRRQLRKLLRESHRAQAEERRTRRGAQAGAGDRADAG